MIKKISSVFGILKQVDAEDIKALKEFILVVKSNGLTIKDACERIIEEFKFLSEELKD